MAGPLTNILPGDYARLDGLLRRALTAGDAINRAASAEFRAGLLTHISLEETILLPAAQRWQGGAPLPMAAKLRLDHGALAALLVPTPTPAILAAHNAVEEGPGGVYSAASSWPGRKRTHCWPSCRPPQRCRWPRMPTARRSWRSCAARWREPGTTSSWGSSRERRDRVCGAAIDRREGRAAAARCADRSPDTRGGGRSARGAPR